MKRTTLYLTRHGQTEWNVARKIQGHNDSPLTEHGLLQADWLCEVLRDINFNAIYSSTSLRAVKTAEIIRGNREVNIIAKDDLREIGMGDWEGLERDTLEEKYREEYSVYCNAPHLYKPASNGESYFDVQQRVLPLIRNIVASHHGTNVMIVTHTVTLKLIMGYFENRPLERLWDPPFIHPTCLCKVAIEDNTALIELHGDTSHYRESDEGI